MNRVALLLMEYRIFVNSPERLTIKSQVFEGRNPEEIVQPTAAFDKQHSSAEIGRARTMEGTANKLQPPSPKGSVALECFGLSKVRFAGYLRASQIRAQVPKGTTSCCRRIWLARSDQSEDQPDKFFGRMRYGNVVVFSFGSLLCQICSESRIPDADEPSGIK